MLPSIAQRRVDIDLSVPNFMKFSLAIKTFENWKRLQSKSTTVMGFACELRAFCLYLRDPEVESITATMVLEYLEALLALGWKRNTLAHKCNYLRGFFRFLHVAREYL